MKAMVLCGGKGTRLRPYTHKLPKSMLLLGKKPILEYIIEYLKRQGVEEVILTVGHLKEVILEHFGDGSEFGIKIDYSIESDESGTAGSVKLAMQNFQQNEDFIVTMGDQLTNVNLTKFMETHKKKGVIASIALKKIGIPFQYGTAETKDGHIVGFEEKPIITKTINSGIYALNPEITEYMPDKGDFARDVFPSILRDNRKLGAYIFDDYWMDIGQLHDYESANETISLIDLITNKS